MWNHSQVNDFSPACNEEKLHHQSKLEETTSKGGQRSICTSRPVIRLLMQPLLWQRIFCVHNPSQLNLACQCGTMSEPAGRSWHSGLQFFAVQNWEEDKLIKLKCILGVTNPMSDLTESLECAHHACHSRCVMGHCQQSSIAQSH